MTDDIKVVQVGRGLVGVSQRFGGTRSGMSQRFAHLASHPSVVHAWTSTRRKAWHMYAVEAAGTFVLNLSIAMHYANARYGGFYPVAIAATIGLTVGAGAPI